MDGPPLHESRIRKNLKSAVPRRKSRQSIAADVRLFWTELHDARMRKVQWHVVADAVYGDPTKGPAMRAAFNRLSKAKPTAPKRKSGPADRVAGEARKSASAGPEAATIYTAPAGPPPHQSINAAEVGSLFAPMADAYDEARAAKLAQQNSRSGK